MVDSGTTPPPEPPPRNTVDGTIRESRKLIQVVTALTTEKAQVLALGMLTVFTMALCGWFAWRMDYSREKDKDREQQYRDQMQRECNAQAELSRMGQKELIHEVMSSLTMHQSQEREKDRQHELVRDRESLKTIKEIRDAWAAFAVRITDLERFLRGKHPNGKPPDEDPNIRELLIPQKRSTAPPPCNPPG